MSWKMHKGLLIRRLLYLVVFAGIGAGLSFLTQRLWGIQWYSLFIPIAAAMALLAGYHVLTLCFGRLSVNEDGIVFCEGLGGTRVTAIPYRQIASYFVSGDKLDSLLGYVKVTVTRQKGVAETEDHLFAIPAKDANKLFDIWATEIAKAPQAPKEIP